MLGPVAGEVATTGLPLGLDVPEEVALVVVGPTTGVVVVVLTIDVAVPEVLVPPVEVPEVPPGVPAPLGAAAVVPL